MFESETTFGYRFTASIVDFKSPNLESTQRLLALALLNNALISLDLISHNFSKRSHETNIVQHQAQLKTVWTPHYSSFSFRRYFNWLDASSRTPRHAAASTSNCFSNPHDTRSHVSLTLTHFHSHSSSISHFHFLDSFCVWEIENEIFWNFEFWKIVKKNRHISFWSIFHSFFVCVCVPSLSLSVVCVSLSREIRRIKSNNSIIESNFQEKIQRRERAQQTKQNQHALFLRGQSLSNHGQSIFRQTQNYFEKALSLHLVQRPLFKTSQKDKNEIFHDIVFVASDDGDDTPIISDAYKGDFDTPTTPA